MNERKIQFHTLDALRFFAFFKVFLLHIPLVGYFPVFEFLKSGGGFGVYFFFTLSGFLITYLLAFEKKNAGQIHLKKFFLRRSFRIWPLYFLILTIVFLLPYDAAQQAGLHITGGYNPDWKYSFPFLENYVMLYKDCPPIATPLPIFWSLCIEEHFYVAWMIGLFFIPFRKVHFFLFSAIAVSWVSRFIEPYVFQNVLIRSNDLFTTADYFAIGGILGYAVARNYDSVAGISRRISIPFKYILTAGIIAVVICHQYILPETSNAFYIVRSTIIALLFTLLIFLFIPQDSKFRIGEKNILSRLGRISYGLYVYHIIFIHLSIQFCTNYGIPLDQPFSLLIFTLATFTLTVFMSYISQRFFEKPFLQLREKFYRRQAV